MSEKHTQSAVKELNKIQIAANFNPYRSLHELSFTLGQRQQVAQLLLKSTNESDKAIYTELVEHHNKIIKDSLGV